MNDWINRLVARPDIQDRFAKFPLIRHFVKRDGSDIFDIVQGFARSQTLFALVSLDIPSRLSDGPATVQDLTDGTKITEDRMALLLRAGVGIGLLRKHRGGTFDLTRKGAALTGVPGLSDLVLHHKAFYADMADPLALLHGDTDTELSAFWPYVHGAAAAEDTDTARRYSDLMARTQHMVAQDTLATISLADTKTLLDVGGGSGAFLVAAARQAPDMDLHLFDLPAVLPLAETRMKVEGLSPRFTAFPGSFRDDPLPTGADAISLIRVLYDHDDTTVRALLASVFRALPEGGRLIVSEPMSGGETPDPATDVYFAFYTLAMKTGRTRSQGEIARLCAEAGFTQISTPRPKRPFITSVLTAHK